MFKKYLNSILSQSLFRETRLCNFAPPPTPPTGPALPGPSPDPEPAAPSAGPTVDRAEVRGRTKAELAAKKGETERDIFKSKLDRKMQKLKRLDLLELSRKRREFDIDPESLEHQSEEKLSHTMDVLQNQLGFLTNTEAKWLKGQLSYAYDPEIWKNKERNDLRSLYQFPDGKLDKIAQDPGKGGRGGEMFLLAYTYLLTVKKLLKESRDSNSVIDKNMRESDRDGAFVAATDKAQEIGGKMMKAVEDRDYPEIAKYAVAGWLFYKVYKNFKDSSSENAKTLKKFAIYGGALYCGLSIFAPDYLKELKGKGVNADIKGTAFENLDSLLSRNPTAYEKGIEVGLMASLANAPVKEIFGSITPTSSFYDPEASASQIIHLDNPAFSGFLPKEVVSARPFPGKKPPFSAMEKLYIKTSEQLFKSVQGLKRMYEVNVYPTEGVTFEEKFLSEKSQDYTIHDLVYQLSVFTTNYKEQFWTPKLLHKARLDLTGPAGVFKDIDGMVIPNAAPSQALLNATVMGYPVSIRINETPTGRKYNFYLAPDDAEGATAVSEYTLGSKDSASMCRSHVVEAINARANKMLRSVTTADEKLGIKWDGRLGQWAGTILTSPVEKFKIDPTTISVLVEFTPDGRKAIMTSDGSKSVIVIDEIMALDYEYAPLVINKVINQDGKGGNDDFTALRVFQNNGEIRFEDIKDSDEHFLLHFPGEQELRVGFDSANDRFYVVDKDQEKELVQSLAFRKEYVESLDRRDNSPFKVFDKMKDYVPEMPEGHVLYFFKELGTWVTDAKISNIAAGVDDDCINGTVPEYFTAMLIDSKKQALKYKLMWEIEQADTLGGVNDARLRIQDTLTSMESFYKKVFRDAKPENGSNWERNEYLMKVIQPLRSAGTQSEEYAYATNRFETHMLSKLDLKGSDWSENLHNVAGKLLGTFYFFTSHLDEAKLDEYSTEDQKKYSNLRARYFMYVENEVIDQSRILLKEGKSPENIPDWPGKFDIKMFADEWTGKSDAPIDVEDTREKLSMVTIMPNGRTELEDKLFKSYQKVISDLRKDLGTDSKGGLDWTKVNSFAAQYFGFDPAASVDALAGTHSPDVLLPNEDRAVYMDALALNYGTNKRSQQITQIPVYAERFRAKIFDDDTLLRDGGSWKDIKDFYRLNRPHHWWMP